MEQTNLMREVFSLVSNLIGGRKWIYLAKDLQIYPEERFNDEIRRLEEAHRSNPKRIWTCLTEWRMKVGREARPIDIVKALHNIKIHWLADQITVHLISQGVDVPLTGKVETHRPREKRSITVPLPCNRMDVKDEPTPGTSPMSSAPEGRPVTNTKSKRKKADILTVS